MRICMLIPHFYPWVGGAERQALLLARALNDLGHQAWVLTRRLPGTVPCEVVRGVPVRRTLAFGSSALFFLSSLLALSYWRHLYQVLHVHTIYSPAIAASLVRWVTRVPVIVKVPGREQLVFSRKGASRRWRFSVVGRSVSRFVAVNQAIEEELGVAGVEPGRIVSIPNGVDTREFRPLPAAGRQSERCALGLSEGMVALFAGRLVPGKGVGLLLKAWRELAARHPDARLVVLGDGPLHRGLLEQAQDLDLETRVRFVGSQTHAQVLRYLQAADVFVLPSSVEGISNALLEAMAVGVVPVVSRVEGNRDVVRHGVNGLLFDVTSGDDLVDCLDQALGSSGLRMTLGEEARRTVVQRFAMPGIAARYSQLYDEVVGGR